MKLKFMCSYFVNCSAVGRAQLNKHLKEQEQTTTRESCDFVTNNTRKYSKTETQKLHIVFTFAISLPFGTEHNFCALIACIILLRFNVIVKLWRLLQIETFFSNPVVTTTVCVAYV